MDIFYIFLQISPVQQKHQPSSLLEFYNSQFDLNPAPNNILQH